MSSIVFPLHDPKNIETPFIKQLLPTLKTKFRKVFVSVTYKTEIENPSAVEFLKCDNLFSINFNENLSLPGDHHRTGFENAVKNSEPGEILHLCYPDRLVYAISLFEEQYFSDLSEAEQSSNPTLFLRSKKAWETHPTTYYALEKTLSDLGNTLFNQFIDFAWCHLTLTADKLKQALPAVTAHDFVATAQLALFLRKSLNTKSVDWLSWEDPFILNKNAEELKLEREQSSEDIEKRLAYVTPAMKFLIDEFVKYEKRVVG